MFFNEDPSIGKSAFGDFRHYHFSTFNEIGGNPAGMSFGDSKNYGIYSIGSYYESGSFRQTQQPAAQIYGAFEAEGRRKINNWDLSGSVSLNRGRSYDVEYFNRAPRNNQNPYQWADTTGGDWTNNIVSLNGSAAKPLFDGRVALGLSGYYEVMQGARQNVERPLYNYSRYLVVTGFKLKLSENSRAGLYSVLGKSKEEQELGFFNQLNTNAILQRGIGTFSWNTFNSANRTYDGTIAGGNAQFEFHRNQRSLSSSIGYINRSESVQTGISNPSPAGNWNLHELTMSNEISREGQRHRHQIYVTTDLIFGRGVDPQLGGVNVEMQNILHSAGYRLDRSNSPRSYTFYAGFHDYEKEDRVTISAQRISRVFAGIDYHTSLWTDNLSVDLSLGFATNLKNELDYRNENEMIQRIFLPEQEFLSQHTIGTGLEVLYLWERSANRIGTGIRMNHEAGFTTSGSDDVNHRSIISLYLSLFN
ncbi:MAG: hypothetical protein JJU46_06330 [Balneolaceae bacterium]|nr:hypothetical protein [Balneolaceae bacterium]MCH8548186.1 hypothetical protein [Balneolaceae bacterium]